MILDLGLEEQVLERDSLGYEITNDIAKKAGRCLNENRCISLIFLLIENSERALELCQKVYLMPFVSVYYLYYDNLTDLLFSKTGILNFAQGNIL